MAKGEEKRQQNRSDEFELWDEDERKKMDNARKKMTKSQRRFFAFGLEPVKSKGKDKSFLEELGIII